MGRAGAFVCEQPRVDPRCDTGRLGLQLRAMGGLRGVACAICLRLLCGEFLAQDAAQRHGQTQGQAGHGGGVLRGAGHSGNAGWLFTAGEPGVPELQTNVPPAVWGEAGSACDDDALGVLGVVVEHARVGVDGEVDVALLNFFHRL